MSQSARDLIDTALLRRELRRQESAAKSVPYISFILTHVALVLFLVVSFIIDRLVPNPTANVVAKVCLAVIAVLFLASEWIYAIISSRRWKRNIRILQQFEERQRLAEEQQKQKRQEEAIAAEQIRNRSLQHDLERLRERQGQYVPFTGDGRFGQRPYSSASSRSDSIPYTQSSSRMQDGRVRR